MEINSANGAGRVGGINAYTSNALNSGRNQVENQNQASAQSDVSPQDARSVQQAFEVTISQEARMLANGTDTGSTTDQTGRTSPPPESGAVSSQPLPQGSGQGDAARLQASQIVNIVA